MIAKLSQGSSFAGVINYVLKQDAQVVRYSNLSTKRENWAVNMDALAAGNARMQKPVMHFSLSLPPGVKLTEKQWRGAAEAFVKDIALDLKTTQWLAVKHNDQGHDHIHIVINRVQLDGHTISDSYIKLRSHEAAAVAARSVGLEPVKKPERNQEKQLTQRGLAANIRQSIDRTLQGQPITLDKLKADLARDDIKVILNQSQTTGRVSGISFEKDGHAPLKGSTLGKGYTISSLQQRGLVIEQSGKQHQAQQQAGAAMAQAGTQSVQAIGPSGGISGSELSRLRAKARAAGLTQADRDRAAKASQRAHGLEV